MIGLDSDALAYISRGKNCEETCFVRAACLRGGKLVSAQYWGQRCNWGNLGRKRLHVSGSMDTMVWKRSAAALVSKHGRTAMSRRCDLLVDAGRRRFLSGASI